VVSLGVVYTLHPLTFKTSARSLLPQDASDGVRYGEYAKDFGELEDIMIVVAAGPSIKSQRIAYGIDSKRFESRQLLYPSRRTVSGSTARP